MNPSSYILEACVESIDDALLFEKKGANCIEFCAQLDEDGLTPEREEILSILEKLSIPVKIMIRPRAGNFVYSIKEFEKMISDIRFCRESGVKEIVTGILTEEKKLNIAWLEVLGSIAQPMKITLHKCIDFVGDPLAEIDRLKSIPQITSILTSGQSKTAENGKELIKKMIERFNRRFTIIPAGKITAENLGVLHDFLGARHYHGKKIIDLR